MSLPGSTSKCKQLICCRHYLLKRMGDSKRIKGQDHPSGSSEYYLMVPGGIQTLKDALVDINVNGELLICCVAAHHAAVSSTGTD